MGFLFIVSVRYTAAHPGTLSWTLILVMECFFVLGCFDALTEKT